MHGLAEKSEQHLVFSEIEAPVVEDPILFPVIVVDGVLVNVPFGVFEPTICGSKVAEPVQTPQKLRLFKPSGPMERRRPYGVD